LKIGIETEILTQQPTGIAQVTRSLIEAIKQQNNQAVCFHSKSGLDLYPPGVEHHYFYRPLKLPYYQSIASLFRYRCFNQVDVMHFPLPKILYFKKPKAPFILTVHDLIPIRFPHFFPKKNYFMMKYFLPRYLKDAKAIIAVSHHTKQDLLDLFPVPAEKVHVIYNTLIPKDREISLEKKNYLFYLGTFEPRKNLKGIIEAFRIIRSWGFDYKLILAGKEDQENQVPWKLIHKNQLQNYVIYKGYITEKEKETLFKNAAAFVWPSFYEGFGLPLLEAMQSGTPIVTSKGSSIEEIVGDAAICVDPNHPLEIARAVEKIISSKKITAELIQKGLDRSRDFSFEEMARSLKNLYESVARQTE
jgi:glycosyltransferase involved in cell wall biosynthesis